MELQQIQQQLISDLEKEQGKVIKTDIWCIPVHTYQVEYQPIQKKSMDILMKILLFSFQKSKFKNAQQLSDILIVEPLFIEDLISKLLKNGLLEKGEGFFQLSEKGKSQFSQGVFEEVLDSVTEEILYSPVHEEILEGNIENVLDFDDFPDKLYRYLKDEEQEIQEEDVLKEIQLKGQDEDIEIKRILSMEHIQTNDLPCIEFIVEKKNETIVRIWNTLKEDWDQTLEKQISEKELG